MSASVLIAAALAAYRLSYMIAREEGPLSIFEWVRGKFDPAQKTWIGRGLNCILCVSFWMTGLFALIIGASWIEWLAMAGAIVVYREIISRGAR